MDTWNRLLTKFSYFPIHLDWENNSDQKLQSLGIMGDQLSAPWNTSYHHSTIVLRSLRGQLIGPPLCRETPVSRTADVFFSSLIHKFIILIYPGKIILHLLRLNASCIHWLYNKINVIVPSHLRYVGLIIYMLHRQKYISDFFFCIKTNLDCNRTFPMDVAPNKNSVWCQINRNNEITIQIRFNVIKLRNIFIAVYYAV